MPPTKIFQRLMGWAFQPTQQARGISRKLFLCWADVIKTTLGKCLEFAGNIFCIQYQDVKYTHEADWRLRRRLRRWPSIQPDLGQSVVNTWTNNVIYVWKFTRPWRRLIYVTQQTIGQEQLPAHFSINTTSVLRLVFGAWKVVLHLYILGTNNQHYRPLGLWIRQKNSIRDILNIALLFDGTYAHVCNRECAKMSGLFFIMSPCEKFC